MPSEFGPVRMKPLSSVLEGRDPGQYLYDLLSGSSDARIYVRVPANSQCEFKEAKLLKAHLLEPADLSLNSPYPTYLQLDEMQVQELLEKSIVDLKLFSKGAMFLRRRRDGKPSLDYDYRRIRQGYLKPPHVLSVSFTELFIEQGSPDDPYNLEGSSPLVYEILKRAIENRGKKKSEVDTDFLAREFQGAINAKYGFVKNPKPFNDRRQQVAANLSNPGYIYDKTPGREARATIKIPGKEEAPFFHQDFLNDDFRRVLYAACRWSGKFDPKLMGDPKELVGLLHKLGFHDSSDSDEAATMTFFITMKKFNRKDAPFLDR